MTAIPTFDFTLPNRRQSQEVFDEAYQKFIDRLPVWTNAANQLALELNALADVTLYDPAAIYNQSGYTKPSTVYASDGMTYRCIGENVQGDNPVGSVTGNWVRITLRLTDTQLWPIPAGVEKSGQIMGLHVTRLTDHTVSVSAGIVFDANNEVVLSRSAAQAASDIVTLPSTVNALNNLFLCDDGMVRYDQDVTGETLLSAYDRHWIMFWPNNAAGNLKIGAHKSNLFVLGKSSEATISNLTATWTKYSHASILPPSKIEHILYGMRDAGGAQGHAMSSMDGTNVEAYIGCGVNAVSDTDPNAWGGIGYQANIWLPFSSDRFFKMYSDNGKLLVHAMRITR